MTPPALDLSSLQLPRSEGHFLLESGLHARSWLALDGLFSDPAALSPFVRALAGRLAPFRPEVVCGPLVGGAFLAQALATELGVLFGFAEPDPGAGDDGLFGAAYRLPGTHAQAARGRLVALVDDAVSAGSSVRATRRALATVGGEVVVLGTLLALGDEGLAHFTGEGVPVEALERRPLELWAPEVCPLCREGQPLVDPTRATRP